MNTQTLRGNWHIVRGKLKQKYASLTDNDLHYVEGKEEELIGRIQKLTGASRDEIDRIFNDDHSLHQTHAR
ncbi:MAG TPA: CsbD family protein [Opitutaceae bacterium]|nr:CsbD family protein [Opitutaceae bacterium]